MNVLEELYRHTGHGGVFHAFDATLPSIQGRGFGRFCSACVNHAQTTGFCYNNACTAALQGHAIGDVWYFRCWLGLDSLSIAIAPEGEITGTIEVGGFFSPGETQAAQETILSRINTLTPGSLGALPLDALQGIRELNFKQVKGLADFLMEATFSCGLNQAGQFNTRKRIYNQQQRLIRQARDLEVGNRSSHAELFEQLVPLIDAIKRGGREKIMRKLDTFLGVVLLRSEGNLDRTRAALVLLLSALLQENIEQGDQWKSAVHRFEEHLLDLEALEAVEEAFLWVEDIVVRDAESDEKNGAVRKNRDALAGKILAWMEANFTRKITLAEAAEAVAASPSAITHRLKLETGRSFSQHLTALRISEAKRLLVYTDLSLNEISTRCGFSEQSYFTKVFRRVVNLTPGEFRSMLS